MPVQPGSQHDGLRLAGCRPVQLPCERTHLKHTHSKALLISLAPACTGRIPYSSNFLCIYSSLEHNSWQRCQASLDCRVLCGLISSTLLFYHFPTPLRNSISPCGLPPISGDSDSHHYPAKLSVASLNKGKKNKDVFEKITPLLCALISAHSSLYFSTFSCLTWGDNVECEIDLGMVDYHYLFSPGPIVLGYQGIYWAKLLKSRETHIMI